MNRRAAFTLPEVMVSLAILGIVSVFLMEMLVRQTQTYQIVDQVAEAQTNLRVITGLASNELRLTGFMVPEGAAVCGVDRTDAPDIVVLTDSAAINPTGHTENDLGARITGGYDGSNTDTLLLQGNSTIDAVPFYDRDGNGVQDTDFVDIPGMNQRGAVIVTDRNNPSRGTSCGQIIANSLTIGASNSSIQIDYDFGTSQSSQALRGVLAGDNPQDLVAIPAVVYLVNGANQLTRNGVVLAEDVEDMQAAYFFDVDGDGVVDGDPRPTPQMPPFSSDSEYPGSTPAGVLYQSGTWDHSELREIRLSMVVRTRAQDQAAVENAAMAVHTFIAMENRVAPAQPPDGFRRRVLTMTVQPRNLGRR
jgi:prepilin-type N-terminal cleavage/methylation domain-containing protein